MQSCVEPARLEGRASRVLIVGYFGQGVLGDEAILASMAASLRRTPGLRLTATSFSPAETEATHGVAAVQIRDLAEILGALREADLVLVGGGGVYNEYSSWRTETLFQRDTDFNVLCAGVPYMCWSLGKPCMIYAAGVEPLHSVAARSHVVDAFRLAGVATVRDKGSADVLKAAGCPARLFRVTADPAFGVPRPDGYALEGLAARYGIDRGRPMLGVSLRHWNLERFDLGNRPNAWENEVAAALRAHLAETEDQLLLLPFQKHPGGWVYADDTVVFRRLMERLPEGRCILVDEQLKADELVGLLSFCRMVLAMRFHSVVLSAVSEVPCVAISYSLKVHSAMDTVGLGDLSVPLETLDADGLLDALRRCQSDLPALRGMVAARKQTMVERNEENVALALDLLAEGAAAVQDPAARALRTHAAALLERHHKLLLRDGTTEVLWSSLRRVMPRLASTMATLPEVHQTLEEIVRIAPKDAFFLFYRAFSDHSRGDLEAAVAGYGQAIELGCSPHWALFHRGRCHHELGRHAEAEADLRAAVACGGGSPAAEHLDEWYPQPDLPDGGLGR